jgi:hypothetical protein
MSPPLMFGGSSRCSRLFRIIPSALMTCKMQRETNTNTPKQPAEGKNQSSVSGVLAKPDAASITPEELRRHKALTRKLDWPNLSINELRSIERECEKLNHVGSFTASAWLVRPDPSSHEEGVRDRIKIAERARVEIERLKQRGPAPRKQHLTPREEKVLDVIRNNPSLTGMDYCRALAAAKACVEHRWVAQRCPRTYPTAYQAGRKWQRRIIREKSRLKRLL